MLNEVLVESFLLIWEMYEEAIREIPDDHWKTGTIDYLTPARLISHVILTGEYYLGDTIEFDWKHKFGKGLWEMKQSQLPSKEEILDYHSDVKRKITDWLDSQSDESILSRELVFPWTGSTRMSRVLYLLAHYRQHFGEINAELRRRGLDRIKWKTH